MSRSGAAEIGYPMRVAASVSGKMTLGNAKEGLRTARNCAGGGAGEPPAHHVARLLGANTLLGATHFIWSAMEAPPFNPRLFRFGSSAPPVIRSSDLPLFRLSKANATPAVPQTPTTDHASAQNVHSPGEQSTVDVEHHRAPVVALQLRLARIFDEFSGNI